MPTGGEDSARVDLVAPGQPVAEAALVEVGAAGAEGEQRGAEREQRLALVLRGAGRTAVAAAATDSDRHFDLAAVPTDGLAVTVEHRQLVSQLVALHERVPDVGVLGDEAQRLAFATASDEHGDVAVGVGLSRASRDSIRGRASRRSLSRLPAVPNSYPYSS